MDIIEAIYKRHAVRHFDGRPLTQNHIQQLNELINEINHKSGLHIQLVVNEPKAFNGGKAARCNFTGCVNYLAIIGQKSNNLNENAGYYGEQIVLRAQQLGINSCWVLLTFNNIENAYKLDKNETLVCVVALGYGTTQGKPHNSKTFDQICVNRGNLPDWFNEGVKLAMLSPTGKNQQGFTLELQKGDVVKLTNNSLCKDLDAGIVKYHFEIGARGHKFTWYK